MRSWNSKRDCTYSGYRLGQVRRILSDLGHPYTVEAEVSPKLKDFEPDDSCRVAYTELRDGLYVICVSQLK